MTLDHLMMKGCSRVVGYCPAGPESIPSLKLMTLQHMHVAHLRYLTETNFIMCDMHCIVTH